MVMNLKLVALHLRLPFGVLHLSNTRRTHESPSVFLIMHAGLDFHVVVFQVKRISSFIERGELKLYTYVMYSWRRCKDCCCVACFLACISKSVDFKEIMLRLRFSGFPCSALLHYFVRIMYKYYN